MGSQPFRNREHPLPGREPEEDPIGQMGGDLGHAACVARGAPRPLQLNARSRSCPQESHRIRANPLARIPHRRYARKSRSIHEDTPQPLGSSSPAVARNVSRWCRTTE